MFGVWRAKLYEGIDAAQLVDIINGAKGQTFQEFFGLEPSFSHWEGYVIRGVQVIVFGGDVVIVFGGGY